MTKTASAALDAAERVHAGSSTGFDWAMIALCAWFQFGAYLDGWAHIHLPELETFFSPWHAVLYSGFLAVTALTVGSLIRNHARGHPWRRALPGGYGLSLLGVLIFMAGGVGDMIWHLLFGIEADVEALLSPTHLVLALGAALIYSGPLRSAWRRSDFSTLGWFAQLPMVVSAAFLLSLLTFFTQYAHPFSRPWPALGNRPTSTFFPVEAPDPLFRGAGVLSLFVGQSMGIVGILLQMGLLMGVVLLVVGRWSWSLPPGALTIVFTVNAILMGFMRDEKILIPGAALAGLAADLLLKQLKPSVTRPGALRLFAFAVPAIYCVLYFVTLMFTKGVWWSIHLWMGSIVLTGIVGWLMSYLLVPPWTADQRRLAPMP